MRYTIDKEMRRTIIRLQKEGWQVPNIAYIAKVDESVVKEILKDANILM